MSDEIYVSSFAKTFLGRAAVIKARVPNDTPADEDIIDLVASGDTEAFGILVKRYEDFVFTLVRGLVISEEQARDISQEVFLRAYRALRRFERKSSFKTWLYRIAYNTSMSHLKRMHNNVESIQDLNLEQEQRSSVPHPAKYLLRRLIDKLNPELKAVVIFHYYDDLKYEEIAEILDCPLGTVKVRLFRAKHELKKLWENNAIFLS
jgi:RNA polymerase sigma-70 factor, ECF subfamily